MVKTITITDEAYKKLKMLKERDESFTNAIIRMARRNADIAKYAGILTEKEADALSARIGAMRKESEPRLEKIRKEMKGR